MGTFIRLIWWLMLFWLYLFFHRRLSVTNSFFPDHQNKTWLIMCELNLKCHPMIKFEKWRIVLFLAFAFTSLKTNDIHFHRFSLAFAVSLQSSELLELSHQYGYKVRQLLPLNGLSKIMLDFLCIYEGLPRDAFYFQDLNLWLVRPKIQSLDLQPC